MSLILRPMQLARHAIYTMLLASRPLLLIQPSTNNLALLKWVLGNTVVIWDLVDVLLWLEWVWSLWERLEKLAVVLVCLWCVSHLLSTRKHTSSKDDKTLGGIYLQMANRNIRRCKSVACRH